MTIREDSQLLSPGSRVSLFQLDGTAIDPEAGVLYFHGHQDAGIITWQGIQYHPWPIAIEGFQRTADKPPTPSVAVANLDGSITALCLQFDDFIGATLIRKQTLVKYLDAVNFPGGNVNANSTQQFPDEVWYIDRKESEDNQMVKWALSSALDFNGVRLPGRKIVANLCSWKYRSAECGYAGGPVAKYDDTPTSSSALDNCSRRVSGCKLRFGADNELPYGSFPAAGLIR